MPTHRFFVVSGKAEVKQPKKWDTAVRSQENQYRVERLSMQYGKYENLMRNPKNDAPFADFEKTMSRWGDLAKTDWRNSALQADAGFWSTCR